MKDILLFIIERLSSFGGENIGASESVIYTVVLFIVCLSMKPCRKPTGRTCGCPTHCVHEYSFHWLVHVLYTWNIYNTYTLSLMLKAESQNKAVCIYSWQFIQAGARGPLGIDLPP